MNHYGNRAHELFCQGFNCSQSVAAAFSDVLGIPEEAVLRMTIGFGAGIGRMRQVCGAFCGTVFVISTLYSAPDGRNKSEVYAIIQQLAQEYAQRNGGGTIICQELLHLSAPEHNPNAELRTETYYQKRPCPELCRTAAQLTAEYIAAHPVPNY